MKLGVRYGVRDLESLKDRCFVDKETGCWHWRQWKNEDGLPMVVMRLEPNSNQKRSISGRRAAMILSGKNVTQNHRTWPKPKCYSKDCVNPDHTILGTRAEWHAHLASTGVLKGNIARAVKAKKTARSRSIVTPTIVAMIQAYEGPAHLLEKPTGLSKTTINDIRSGRRWADLSGGMFTGLMT